MGGLLLAGAWCAFFLLLIRRWAFFRVPGLDQRLLPAVFLLKLAAGTGLWWLYTYHWTDRTTADIFKYFDDGNVLFSALPDHPADYLRMLFGIGNDSPRFDALYYTRMDHWYRQWDTGYYNDAHTMIRFSAFVRLFSFGHYHVHTVFACFCALLGLMALYKAFLPAFQHAPGVLFAGIFLWPSVLFWGSAPIKEALLLAGLGPFLLGAMRWIHGASWRSALPLSALGLAVLLVLKSYVLLCLLPGLLAYAWCRRSGGRNTGLKFAAVLAALVAALLLLPLLHPPQDLPALIARKRQDMLGVVSLTDPGSDVPMVPLQPGILALLADVPHALWLSFCSPFRTAGIGLGGLVAAVENALMLMLIPLALLRHRPWRQLDLPLLGLCLGFCIALALLVGWTTPVVGALLRYRMPMLPFWAMAAFAIMDLRKPLFPWKKTAA